MTGIFKIKFLWFGLFLASPPMAAWALRGGVETENTPVQTNIHATAASSETDRLKVPVEVVTGEGKTQWMMVEVTHEAIPEPGAAVLLAVSSLLLLRRHREE